VITVGDSTIRRPAKSRSSYTTQSVINPVMEVLITEVPFYKPTCILALRLLVPNPRNFLEARFWITSGWPTNRPES
jgi:hypothetical protein